MVSQYSVYCKGVSKVTLRKAQSESVPRYRFYRLGRRCNVLLKYAGIKSGTEYCGLRA